MLTHDPAPNPTMHVAPCPECGERHVHVHYLRPYKIDTDAGTAFESDAHAVFVSCEQCSHVGTPRDLPPDANARDIAREAAAALAEWNAEGAAAYAACGSTDIDRAWFPLDIRTKH